MGHWFSSLDAIEVMSVGVSYFAALYLLTGGIAWWLGHRLLPALGIGRRLDPRPLPRGQLRRELGASAISILVFGAGLIVPWGMLQLGWARLADDPSAWRVLIEIAVLFLWNELHFYVNHRLLHTPWLRRFHGMHHRSHIATPFSTYAFHPVEAVMLGSVPLIPMLLHDFSFVALATLPVLSIVLNNLGHSNYEASRAAPASGWLGASRRHHLHHACYHGNYGFLLEVFDRWAGTVLPLDAADGRIATRSREADAA
ncbi:MAG TPA: sterol desaturase family protein [Lysobacter sp.]